MDYAAFLRLAAGGEPPAVVLLHGPDAQLLDDALATVTRALFPDAGAAAFDREVVDGRATDAPAIVRAALTLPVQAVRRLVAVRRCQALPARAAEVLGPYLASPSPTTCLLLLADESLRAGRDRKGDHWLLEAVGAAASIELPIRRGRALEDWLRQRAGAEGIGLSPEAARLLVQWVGDDSARLLGEARKAALAADQPAATIGVTEVAAVVGEHRISAIFELSRAIERRDRAVALRTLDRLLGTEDPLLVLAALTRDVRTAWTIREWRARGQSIDQIARSLRRPPGVVEAMVTSAEALPSASLSRYLRRCWEVERRIKSGGEPHAEIAVLVADLCEAR